MPDITLLLQRAFLICLAGLLSIGLAWAQEDAGIIKISFRSTTDAPAGFIVDSGKDFSAQGALTYGWQPGTKHRFHRRWSNENPMVCNAVRVVRGSQWQISLPKGRYAVSICVGAPDEDCEVLPLLVQEVPYFKDLQAGKNVFLKQTRTVEVGDGPLTLRLDETRLSKDWDIKNRYVPVNFLEILPVSAAAEDRLLTWSIESAAATDREFYGLVPDIHSTLKPAGDLLSTLWYTRPAKIWEEGLPLGNGRLGAVVYGNPTRERIQLNEDTLWNGAPDLPFANPDGKAGIDEARRMIFANRPNEEVWKYIYDHVFKRADGKFGPFMFDYLNGGDVILSSPDGRFDNYHRSLNLEDGIASTQFALDGVTYRREVFTSVGSNVVVVRLTADKPGSITFSAEQRDFYDATLSGEGSDTLIVDGKVANKNGIASVIRYHRRLKAVPEGGRMSVHGTTLTVEKADAVTVLIATRTNFINYHDVSGDAVQRAKDDIAAAGAKSYQALLDAHLADHRGMFRRMSLDLGPATTLDLPTDERIRRFRTSSDPQMAALVWQFGRYLMMGCSRPGTQAANLQGIWNEWPTGAWGGKYTVNINIQMNYWLPEPANLAECHQPFMDLINGVADMGRATAKDYYGARGWVCHHNTDIWRYNHPIDLTAGMWPMASAWFCDHIWERYQYSLDKEFLKKMYPVMRDAALFYVDSLVKDPRSGWLVTAPSMSPEMAGIVAAPTMDVELLNSLFTRTVAAARILGVDPDLQQQFEATRLQLPPLKIGSWGQLQEFTHADLDDPKNHHRHVSHLYALYPGDQITPWKTPELFAAAKVSLLARGDEATGWSLGWKVNFWARLRDGDHAYQILKLLIKPSFRSDTTRWGSGLYPNFLDAHAPFQIDGNFGAAAGVMEMLVQSQNGEIDLLPALPSEWPTGSITGMRVRGGFTIDLAWIAGKPTRLTVTSTNGTICAIRHGQRRMVIAIPQGKSQTLDLTTDAIWK